MKSASLAMLLAGGAASMKGMENVKKFYEGQQKVFAKAAKAEEGRVYGLTEQDRVLASSNTNFLNYNLYQEGSADSCSQKPYARTGYGSDVCMNGIRTQCEGPVSSLNITYWVYNNDDCTELLYVRTDMFDGSCKTFTDDDDSIFHVDDRIVDDFYYYNARTIEFMCESSANYPDYIKMVGYVDSGCETVGAYYGLNNEACIPGPDEFSAIISKDCTVNAYGTGDCTGASEVITDDDNYSGDYGYDDFVEGSCVENGDDDYLIDYFTYERFCSSGDDGDDDLCFAGSETILLASGVTKTLADVQVGDMVQVVSADGSLKFSEVVFLPHSANTQKATFTELQLASGNSLRATAAHFVLAGECGADAFELTAMKDVTEGSCVQTTDSEDEVSRIATVVDHGVYTLVTKETSGLVVVNGIRASSFAHNHWVMNNYYNIHRAVYAVAPSLMKNRDVIAANLMVGDIALSL